jgi:hypothetical protein
LGAVRAERAISSATISTALKVMKIGYADSYL